MTDVWLEYQSTRLLIDHPGGSWVVEPAPQGTAGTWALPTETLHVVTACNPRSVKLSPEENEMRHARLQVVTELLGYQVTPVTGAAFDGQWAEIGVGVWNIARDHARAIGVLFDQTAIFELCPEALRVIGCFEVRIIETGWKASFSQTPGQGAARQA